MSTYIDLHPQNPQTNRIKKLIDIIENDAVVALPTDSGYALACKMGSKKAMDAIKNIRQLNDKHNFSVLCSSFAQLGELVILDNSTFRTIKSLTPGPYTFILKASKQVPRMMLNKKKHTIGVRLPDHNVLKTILQEYGKPILCSTLMLPGQDQPMYSGWEVQDELGHILDAVVDAPVGVVEPTTVVDFSEDEPVVLRKGAGDTSIFE